jgi:putative polyketide hydroxylase
MNENTTGHSTDRTTGHITGHTVAHTTDRTSVLIVGGSIVGVSAALFLAACGITPILLEQHVGISPRLRAKLFYPRTMEAYRAVGAAQDIYAIEHSRPRSEYAAVVESLAGAEIRRWRLPAADDYSAVSPCQGAMVKQGDAERVLRTRAAAAGADLRFGHRLIGWEQTAQRVAAEVLDERGVHYAIEADYLLAADGSASSVREALGIARSGDQALASCMEMSFAADLRPLLEGRALALAFADQPGRPFLSWTTDQDAGAVSVTHDPATTDPDTEFTPERCQALVAAALGLPASDFRITGARPWQMAGWVADTFRADRAFLLGDAAHVCPPVGGFGANTGIQDAWNLAAKLVSVLRGDAGARLLDRYEAERRPVAQLTVGQAAARLAGERGQAVESRQAVPVPVPVSVPVLSEAAVTLGYRYPGTADTETGTDLPLAAEPDHWHGEPGTRLPHLPLADTSSLDLVRDGRHALLTGPQGRMWTQAARSLDPRGALLDIPDIPPSSVGPECGIGEDGALLVRPDGVVSWRASHLTAAPAADLETALRQALARDAEL